ncbi:MAG: NAD+ synthase [bacterium]|nr:NAD+ synthase [bacterium]
MKIAIAQLNPIVGDIAGNLTKLLASCRDAANHGAELIVAPELYLCGYPPRDLLSYEWFLDKLDQAIIELCNASREFPTFGIVVGTVRRSGKLTGKGFYNSAVLIENGKILLEQHKQLLPTYDVFDERRYFDPGTTGHVIAFHNQTLGISICEDGWNDPDFGTHREYETDPIELLVRKGATILINISASPFQLGKEKIRYDRFGNHARKWRLPMIFCNQVGANDEIIFDGNSMAFDGNGLLIEKLPSYEETTVIVDSSVQYRLETLPAIDPMESLHGALVLGIRDYMAKCGFKQAVIGLSGGIDSALTACLAVDAIGAENVRGVTMPSEYSSSGSVDDSIELASKLGIRCDTLAIREIYDTYLATLSEPFANTPFGIAEENIQARIRGNLLMAYSNKFGGIVLTTGNKSEIAVGYCTLYGDMSGGLAAISDLPKTIVYQLSRWYNRHREVIPTAIIVKAPSAELRPNQKDQDSLPPYDILDAILDLYLEEQKSIAEIVANGFDPETVKWVIRTVDRNEYKRKQAAPGLRVTSKAFGVGRRMPIAARWSES